MEPQDVPTAPDMKRLMLSIFFARLFVAETGFERNIWYRGRLITVYKRVKRRAILGKDWIQYCT